MELYSRIPARPAKDTTTLIPKLTNKVCTEYGAERIADLIMDRFTEIIRCKPEEVPFIENDVLTLLGAGCVRDFRYFQVKTSDEMPVIISIDWALIHSNISYSVFIK